MIAIQEPAPSQRIPDVVFGIDFGTTNSLVAIATASDNIEIIKTADGKSTLRSVVFYSDTGVHVGSALGSISGAYGLKREMARHECGYDVIVGGSEIFKELKKMVAAEKNLNLEHAVVSVPAYFDSFSRLAVVRAAQLAGIEVIRLINEPTAAAIAYGISANMNNVTYVVYDLGGGTFDVSVLRVVDGVFRVLATGGDSLLGGSDFDELLLQLILEKVCINDGIPNKNLRQELLLAAEDIKISLTTSERAEFRFDMNGQKLECTITKTEFEVVIDSLVKKTINLMQDVMSDVGNINIEKILVVGGATRVPLIAESLRNIFGNKVQLTADPEEIVVKGAAMQGYWLSNCGRVQNNESKLLVDVLPLSLGLEVFGGLTEKIIPRNEPLPAVSVQSFTTQVDNQTSIKVHVYQGENEMVARNRSLAVFDFGGIKPGPAGCARIDVEFRVDIDGLLTVTVVDLAAKNSYHVEVMQNFGLSDEDIRTMIWAAIDEFGNDFAESSLGKKKFSCTKLLSCVRLFCLNKHVSASDIEHIKAKADFLSGMLDKADFTAISSAAKDLEAILNDIMSKMVHGSNVGSV